jgi:hypothetical protein
MGGHIIVGWRLSRRRWTVAIKHQCEMTIGRHCEMIIEYQRKMIIEHQCEMIGVIIECQSEKKMWWANSISNPFLFVQLMFISPRSKQDMRFCNILILKSFFVHWHDFTRIQILCCTFLAFKFIYWYSRFWKTIFFTILIPTSDFMQKKKKKKKIGD